MLLKMEIENFLSFKEKTVASFKRSNYKFLEKRNTFDGVTKGSFFIGGNASGKSNFIKAINVLLALLFTDNFIAMYPLKCRFSDNMQLRLSYLFKIDSHLINYSIDWHEEQKYSEDLKVDDEVVMTRSGSNALYFSEKFDNVFEDGLFLREIYFNTRFREYPVLQKWFDFLRNSVSIDARAKSISAYSKEKRVMLNEYLLDSGTERLNTILPSLLSDKAVTVEFENICSGGNCTYEIGDEKAVFVRRNRVKTPFPLDEESEGTQNLINLLPALSQVTNKAGMLIIDEFSSAFHNFLERRFVDYFYENSRDSQLFMVTHATNLLSSEILRPDQVFTFSFKDDKGSKIIKVSEYAKPRTGQNFEKMYLSGMFEGIPLYDED